MLSAAHEERERRRYSPRDEIAHANRSRIQLCVRPQRSRPILRQSCRPTACTSDKATLPTGKRASSSEISASSGVDRAALAPSRHRGRGRRRGLCGVRRFLSDADQGTGSDGERRNPRVVDRNHGGPLCRHRRNNAGKRRTVIKAGADFLARSAAYGTTAKGPLALSPPSTHSLPHDGSQNPRRHSGRRRHPRRLAGRSGCQCGGVSFMHPLPIERARKFWWDAFETRRPRATGSFSAPTRPMCSSEP